MSDLTLSGPVTATADNQIIEGLLITSRGGDAVTVDAYNGVTLRNSIIVHQGGSGVRGTGSVGLTIDHCPIVSADMQPSGPALSNGHNNIVLNGCVSPTLTNLKLTGGSCGLYALSCSGLLAQYIEGHNIQGLTPRGQFVQFDKSDGAQFLDFSVENDLAVCWTEDCISVYDAMNVVIARGLISGNNSPSGWCVMVEASSAGASVTDVDAINWSNGGFGISGSGGSNTYLRCRVRDSYAPCSQSRGAPSSGGTGFWWGDAAGAGANNSFDGDYYNLGASLNVALMPNGVSWTPRLTNFTPRSPIRVAGLPEFQNYGEYMTDYIDNPQGDDWWGTFDTQMFPYVPPPPIGYVPPAPVPNPAPPRYTLMALDNGFIGYILTGP